MNSCLTIINQSPKQDRDKDEVYLTTSPSQSSAHGVSHDLGSVLAHAGVARQQPGLYRNKVTTYCRMYFLSSIALVSDEWPWQDSYGLHNRQAWSGLSRIYHRLIRGKLNGGLISTLSSYRRKICKHTHTSPHFVAYDIQYTSSFLDEVHIVSIWLLCWTGSSLMKAIAFAVPQNVGERRPKSLAEEKLENGLFRNENKTSIHLPRSSSIGVFEKKMLKP